MLAHSDNWDYAIRQGAQRVTYVDVYYPPNASLPLLNDVPVKEFDLQVDRRSDIRRTLRMTIVSEELWGAIKSTTATHPFEPLGAEFRVKHGVIHADGTEELMPLGTFHSETTAYEDPGAEVKFSLVDRSKILKRKLYGFPRDAGGQDKATMITTSVLSLIPHVDFVVDSDVVSSTVPGGTQHRGDMLTVYMDTAESMAAEFYFDALGRARLSKIPVLDVLTFSGAPVWNVDCGDSGVLVSANTELSRTDTFNRVLVIGVSPSENIAAVYADIQDNDPRSYTYYYGPFGQTDKWIDDNTLNTVEDCIARANAELGNSRGLGKQLSLKSLGNPALEEGDIIKVTYLDGSSEYHLVDGFSLDHKGQMQINTRTTQRR